ncbi:MAG: UDP-N-acetylmuramate dehydrogenase [Oscillospiraceae bacterium]|nr:UDP-N-acetylmuramate dehydrogenase [Oscillospiraceae bacterium]
MVDNISQAIETVKTKLTDAVFEYDVLLKDYTSFKIGGPVRVMFFPKSVECLTDIYDILFRCEVTPFIIGNGSNILANDEKLDIAVINTQKLCEIELQGDGMITAQAGVMLSKLAIFACENGLSGFEFAHGIPGTLGGAIVMNAGAYDGEMKDVVVNTTIYNTRAGIHTITAADNAFSYRKSRFSDTDDIVLSSVISLKKGDKEGIKEKMNELGVRRRESQPLDVPSAGSAFKRPKKGYAAAFIEQAGLKGYTVGGAQVSKKHSGFIVNRGDASFADVMAVIKHVQETVVKQFGVELEPEVKILR